MPSNHKIYRKPAFGYGLVLLLRSLNDSSDQDLSLVFGARLQQQCPNIEECVETAGRGGLVRDSSGSSN